MLSLERRLHGDTKSVHWSPEDIERLSRHYGTRTPDGASQRRDAWSVGVPPLPLATKSDDGATRTFTISTGSIDRMGDAINPHGWHTAGYMRNPVVLWGHDYSRPPIGRATSVWREGESLKAKMVFASSSFAQSVKALVKEGAVRATSVGFRPLEWNFSHDRSREGGIDFKQAELLEFSLVSVPANAEALMELSAGEKAHRRRLRELELIRLRG